MRAIDIESARPPAAPARFTPKLRVYTESLLVERGSRHRDYAERETAVLKISFDYGTSIVPLSDRSAQFYETDGSCVALVERDMARERECLCVLESYGVVEIDCLDGFGTLVDTEADYVISVDANVHALCSFSACALPRLKELGWDVQVDDGYPYQVVRGDAPWYANIEAKDAEVDWFGLELGIEVNGERINMLPALLELLERTPHAKDLDALLRVPAKLRALPVGNNRYVAMPPERLRIMLRILGELYRLEGFDRGRLSFSSVDAATVASLDDAFGGAALGDDAGVGKLVWGGATEIRDRGAALAAPHRIAPTRVAVGLRAVLRPYQEEGLNWLQHLRQHGAGGVLADDMGLGKTLQTIAHLAVEKEARRLDHPSLIVMPTSLVGNWYRELKSFAPHLRTVVLHGAHRKQRFAEVDNRDVVLTTYPLLVRDIEFFREKRFQFVILDEAHAIKTKSSQVNAAVSSLQSEHRLALTGTPIENNLGELWSLFEFLNPGLLGSQQSFRQRYRVPIEKEGNEEQLTSLRQKVAPFILRRMKNLVARDLPPKTVLIRPVELSGTQRDLYEGIRVAAHAQVRQAIKKKGFSGSTIAILDALMKLRQVCCDPRLVSSPIAKDVTESAKYTFLFELLERQLAEGRRILIFSQFTQMLDLIAQGLQERGTRYLSLTGASRNRQEAVDAFEAKKADVFLISLKAGGTGLNLTSADTVIHYDPWWNPAAQAQATDRAYRLGQRRPVFVYNLIVAGSVEERMLELQQRKQHLADTILGVGGSSTTGLSEQEVQGLLEPLNDTQS